MTCQHCDKPATHHVYKQTDYVRLCGECYADE
jgi:hypothetical protein